MNDQNGVDQFQNEIENLVLPNFFHHLRQHDQSELIADGPLQIVAECAAVIIESGLALV